MAAGAALAVVPASAASANDVVLWACHGPDGHALVSTTGTPTGTVTGSCDSDSSALSASLGAQPANNATSAVGWTLRPGMALERVKVTRSATGLTGSTGESYLVWGDHQQTPLEQSSADVPSGTATIDPFTADSIHVGVQCTSSSCTNGTSGPATVNVAGVLAVVGDSQPPTAALGQFHSPAAGPLTLDILGGDAGTGLDHVEAWINNGVTAVQVASARFPAGNCTDLSPDSPQVDLPIDEDCPTNAHASLTIDTSAFPDGDYQLTVRTYDIAGNSSDTNEPLTIWNFPPKGSPTQSLTIGTSSPTLLPSNTNNTTGTGGVLGASASSCSSPKLSMFLSQKPLRVKHGVPVLKRGKRYRYNGTLTCVIKGKRQSAPKRTRIDLLNTVGKKTVTKNGTTVRDKGRITMILAYKTSRTLIFRFINTDGRTSQVKIKISVARK